MKVCVVTPIYKSEYSFRENYSLDNSYRLLQEYEKVIVCPENHRYNLSVRPDREVFFNKSYFSGIKAYNRLMLSNEFYEKFTDYDYILILQTDTFIFKNELLKWCNEKFSYVGAPWPSDNYVQKYQIFNRRIINKIPFMNRRELVRVGNGGLSLRNVRDSIDLLENNNITSKYWVGNEDAFWGLYFNSNSKYKMPSSAIAEKFSLETINHLNNNLNFVPFGCHAWEKMPSNFFRKMLLESKLKISEEFIKRI